MLEQMSPQYNIHPKGESMYMVFSSNRLASAGQNLSGATRMFGVSIGRKHIQRLGVLRAVRTFAELVGLRALRLHQLTGNRAGQYPINLTGKYRLIIERISEDSIHIVGVEDHHGN